MAQTTPSKSQQAQELLRRGIAAARADQRETARRYLQQVIELEPTQEQAWLWLSTVAETPVAAQACLEQALRINPNNTATRQALAALQRGISKPPPSPSSQPAVPVEVLRTARYIEQRGGISPRLGDILVQQGIITPEQLNAALARQVALAQAGNPQRLGAVLLDMGMITLGQLEDVLNEQQRLQQALEIYNRQLEQEVARRTAELQKALAELQQLDKLKSDFLSNVSHELRTPLAYIKGYLSLALEGNLGPLTPELQEGLGVAFQGAERLERIINDLLTFVDLDRGRVAIHVSQFQPTELLAQVERDIKTRAEAKGLSLQVVLPPNPPPLNGDMQALYRALYNLADNAVKFTPEGGQVVLEVSLLPGRQQARLAVRDTGIGIPADQLNKVFDRFYQVDGSSTRRFGGMGLGLALVKLIVEAHGSTVHIESQEGRGTCVYFDLPVAEAA